MIEFFKAYFRWRKRKLNSDFGKIKINPNGSFYMSAADIFDDKNEVKEYCRILNDALSKRNSQF